MFHAFFSCIFGKILDLWKFGDFGVLNLFFHNWSLGFCCGMLLHWSWWINLINLLIWGKLNFSRVWNCSNWGFVQLSIMWWNWLVGLINLIIIYCDISCVIINWSNCWIFWKWVFKIWGFWYKLYTQANFMISKLNWTHSHCIRACIMGWYCSCII